VLNGIVSRSRNKSKKGSEKDSKEKKLLPLPPLLLLLFNQRLINLLLKVKLSPRTKLQKSPPLRLLLPPPN
jgi:hypothetical protein